MHICHHKATWPCHKMSNVYLFSFPEKKKNKKKPYNFGTPCICDLGHILQFACVCVQCISEALMISMYFRPIATDHNGTQPRENSLSCHVLVFIDSKLSSLGEPFFFCVFFCCGDLLSAFVLVCRMIGMHNNTQMCAMRPAVD